MEVKGDHQFKAPRAVVWECMLDPKALHIPGGRNPHFISEHAGKVSLTHVSARGERGYRELGVEILGDPLLDFGDCGLFGRCS